MPYCTTTDIQKMLPDRILIQLTDDEGNVTINTDRLQESIDSAAEEIDAYVGAIAAVPISGGSSTILGKINADIAIYNLYSRLQEKIPETRQTRYDNALRILEKIAGGEVTFGLQPAPAAPETSNATSMAVSRIAEFGAETLDKY